MSSLLHLGLRDSDIAPGRPYLERDERQAPFLDRAALAIWHDAVRPLTGPLALRRLRAARFISRVHAHSERLVGATDAELRTQAGASRRELRADGFSSQAVARTFAVVREAAHRVMAQRHYDTQLAAGWWLLQGSLVEMATGEGKTFAATLPAITAALAGLPVHVITVNDYLAERDAAAMAPLYGFFDLSAGAVIHGLAPEMRRAIYAGDIAYASNKELAFDYLRDRSTLGDRASILHRAVTSVRDKKHATGLGAVVLRGLVFGIVDEADSVFIDEARTPLILSRMVDSSTQLAGCTRGLAIARALDPRRHYILERAARRIRLSDAGREYAEESDASGGESPFGSDRERHEAVEQALCALHLYALDQHYVIVDGKVQIVDESTGRVMPDRAWERGLHQMIEAKEGVELTGTRETLARITYQRLFRRYLRLAGMSGTATEVAAEIGRTYGLAVVQVPLYRPSQRIVSPVRCVRDATSKWNAVADEVHKIARVQGRPVLVGTRTVKASEELSSVLAARGIEHVILNARQDKEEAEIISKAGLPGRVTVATNMAGRGTDIVLGEGVANSGGLHVILTEFHESRRIDRQFIGRSARQGDPGSAEMIVAIDDELFVAQALGLAAWLADNAARSGEAVRLGVVLLRRVAQVRAERRNRDARTHSLQQDRRIASTLAFAGRGE